MFYIDFWGFTNDPLYFGYNSAGLEILVFMFLTFQDPNGVKKSSSSGNINFYPREPTWAQRRSKTRTGRPQEQRPRAHPPGARGAPSWAPRPSDRLDSFAHALVLT